jgi:hypothetical protein
VGFGVDKVAGFLRVLRFPQLTFIPPIAPQSPSSIIWDWYNRLVVAAVPSGLSLTPLIIIIIIILLLIIIINVCVQIFLLLIPLLILSLVDVTYETDYRLDNWIY